MSRVGRAPAIGGAVTLVHHPADRLATPTPPHTPSHSPSRTPTLPHAHTPTPGRFIVLEGLDGSGTTTQVNLLARGLRRRDLPVLTTREPTDGPIGSLVRQFLGGRIQLNPASVALAFAADRLEHIERKVTPALAAGQIVISDRYVLSSLAYQAIDLSAGWIAEINRLARTPDLTVFLDVSPAVCLARITRRGESLEYYERQDRLERVERSYRRAIDAARLGGERVRVIDGEQSVLSVQRAIRTAIRRVLGG